MAYSTETQKIEEFTFSDGSKRNISIIHSTTDNYVTLINATSLFYKKDDFPLKQYKFFYSYDSALTMASFMDKYKNYFVNASICLNHSIEEFTYSWNNASLVNNKSISKNHYYNPLISTTKSNSYYEDELPKHSMLSGSPDDVFANSEKYDEIIKKIIYFSIYSIEKENTGPFFGEKVWERKFLPAETVRKTFELFDCYTSFPYIDDPDGNPQSRVTDLSALNDEVFLNLIKNNMNSFVDEIKGKLDIDTGFFYELKKDFNNPFRILESISNKEPFFNDIVKFYYDTILESPVNKIFLKHSIDKFNEYATIFKANLDKLKESITDEKINTELDKSMTPIIDKTGEIGFIDSLITSSSYIQKNLALKILLQFHSRVEEKEFAVKTFKTFVKSYDDVVPLGSSIDDAYLAIEDDLKGTREENGKDVSISLFLIEFIEIIEALYEKITPPSLTQDEKDNGKKMGLGDISDTYSIKTTYIDYYKSLQGYYDAARKEYSNFKLAGKNTEANDILEKVCSTSYSKESKLSEGGSFINPDPSFKLDKYDCLAYRYLYYAVFNPVVYEINYEFPVYTEKLFERNIHHREFNSNRDLILSNFEVYDRDIRDKGILKPEIEDEPFYQAMKYYLLNRVYVTEEEVGGFLQGVLQGVGGFLPTFIELVTKDFNEYTGEKGDDQETVSSLNDTPKTGLSVMLPSRFNEDYKILMNKNKDSVYLQELLDSWNEEVNNYETEIKTKSKETEDIKKIKEEILREWDGREDNVLRLGKNVPESFEKKGRDYLIKKMAFFYIRSRENKFEIQYESNGYNYNLDKPTKFTYPMRKQNGINEVTGSAIYKGSTILIGEEKYDVKKLYNLFISEAKRIFGKIEEAVGTARKTGEAEEADKERRTSYNNYVEDIKSRISREEDFFYLKDNFGNKVLPTVPSVDVEFRNYYEEEGEMKSNWISVSRIRSDSNDSSVVSKEGVGLNGLYGYNYFSDMELKDTGGKKEISLSLKGIEDLNLEKIIFNSVIKPVKKFNEKYWKENSNPNIDTIQDINNYRSANFRVRFGYNDLVESAINEVDINSKIFSERINNTKPVIKSPWLYFLMNKLDTRFSDGETVFDIGGVNIGSYVLDNYRIYNPSAKTSSYDSISAITGIGIIANILFKASNGNICILSDKPGEIILDAKLKSKENKDDKNEYEEIRAGIRFVGGEKNTLKTSDFDFQGFKYDPDTKKELTEYILTLEQGETTDGGEAEDTLPTAKQVVESLVDFLPTKLFIAPTPKGGGSYLATTAEKNETNMLSSLLKELKMSYDVVEAETTIESTDGYTDIVPKRRSFIRLYYKGPISRDEKEAERIRFYKYRGGETSLVSEVNIENPLDLQKISGVICGFENNKKARLFLSQIGTTSENIGGVGGKVEIENSENGPPIFLWKNDVTTTQNSSNTAMNNISKIANSLTEYTYTGDMKILGDPYFIFDDDLEPFRHMIYLKVNRYENIELQKLADEEYDYYSGLYVIKDINHKINSDGDFSTKLSLMKFTMATEKEKDNNEE